jgi:hypothetical protein
MELTAISLFEFVLTTHEILYAVFEDRLPHAAGDVIGVQAVAVGSFPLSVLDEADVTEFVEMVVEIVGLHIESFLELIRTHLSLLFERIEDPESGFVPDSVLHSEILFELEYALFGQEVLWIDALGIGRPLFLC